MPSLTLTLLPTVFGIARLDPGHPVPSWATAGPVSSITRTEEELSVVCPLYRIPDGVKGSGAWRAYKVHGPLDFALTGVLAGLSRAIAEAGISLFALSTFDTDYLLVPEAQAVQAGVALRSAGYIVASDRPIQK